MKENSQTEIDPVAQSIHVKIQTEIDPVAQSIHVKIMLIHVACCYWLHLLFYFYLFILCAREIGKEFEWI